MQNRSIGTDFISITPLRKDEIKFEATITLDSFAVGEEVLAHIYKNIEESITSKPYSMITTKWKKMDIR